MSMVPLMDNDEAGPSEAGGFFADDLPPQGGQERKLDHFARRAGEKGRTETSPPFSISALSIANRGSAVERQEEEKAAEGSDKIALRDRVTNRPL